MNGKRVKLYALSTCSHCRSAKQLLMDCGIDFDCTEVDQLPMDEKSVVMDEIRKINARCSFPTLVIETTVIVGYREMEIREALGL
jgi:glutaredoxin-like protein NrdH